MWDHCQLTALGHRPAPERRLVYNTPAPCTHPGSELLSCSITLIHTPTYDLPFDLISLLLRRQLHGIVPCACSHGLYAHVRKALLDRKTSRVVVMAHNAGAACTSHVIRQLYADIPAEGISRLEAYTFGAAATDFVMPLGRSSPATAIAGTKEPAGQQPVHTAGVGEHRWPHIEHYAFACDPLAGMGVLRSVREELGEHFCGGVFVLNDGAIGGSRPLMSMIDYMSCLFPDMMPPPGT